MISILEALIVFFVATPLGFLLGVALIVFMEYVIVKGIINNPYKAPSFPYIASQISTGFIETQLMALHVLDTTLTLGAKSLKKIEQKTGRQLEKWEEQEKQYLIIANAEHFIGQPAYLKINDKKWR